MAAPVLIVPRRSRSLAQRLGLPTSRRVGVTLSGLVVLDDPRNPPDEIGERYRWDRVKIRADSRTAIHWDEAGARSVCGGRVRLLRVRTAREARVAGRLHERGLRRMWRDGTLDTPATASSSRAQRLTLLVLEVGVVAALVGILFPAAAQLPQLWSVVATAPPVVRLQLALVLFLVPLYVCLHAFMHLHMAWPMLRAPIPFVRVMRDGVHARLPDGAECRQEWRDLRSLRRVHRGWRLEFIDGTRLDLTSHSTLSPVLELVRRECLPEEARIAEGRERRMLMRAAGIWVIGAFLVGGVAASPLNPGGPTPWLQSLALTGLMAAVMPVLLLVHVWLPERLVAGGPRRRRSSRRGRPMVGLGSRRP